MKRIGLFSLWFFLTFQALAANTQINCGSTYYVPLLQVDWTGKISALPANISLAAQADVAKVTATIGVMPGTTNPAVILKPVTAAAGVAVTVSNPSGALTAGSAPFDIIAPPQTLMFDITNMRSTTP
jgi:hypothetical protein